MIVVGNKKDKKVYEIDDIRLRGLRRYSRYLNRNYGALYVEISARLNRDYEKPFLYLCRLLFKYNKV